MIYCNKCKKIYKDESEHCKCKDKFKQKSEPLADDIVFLVSCYGFDLDRTKAALEDAKIPYQLKLVKNSSGTLPVITGASNSQTNIYVPYEFLSRAEDIVMGIFASKDKTYQEDLFDYDSRKNKLIRSVSLVLFLIMMFAVVTGTDSIMRWIKYLLS